MCRDVCGHIIMCVGVSSCVCLALAQERKNYGNYLTPKKVTMTQVKLCENWFMVLPFLSFFHLFYRLSERAMRSLLSFFKTTLALLGHICNNQLLLDIAHFHFHTKLTKC